MKIRGLLQRLFQVPDKDRTWWQVITWWELRRIPYNLLVGGIGLLSLVLFLAIDALPPQLPTEELNWSPALSVILFGFGANFFYTGGWVAELLARRMWHERAREIGPQLFSIGLVFSLFLALLPSLLNFVGWVCRLAHH